MTGLRVILAGLVLMAAIAACGRSRPVGEAPDPSTTPVSTTVRTVAPRSTTTAKARVIPRRRPSRPPYQVSQVTLHLVDTTRPTISHGRLISPTRSLVTVLWTPDRPGKWPLVVFAHGFDVGPGPYAALLEAWATHGYAVAAPEFPLTDPNVAGPNLDEADIDNQPADVRFVTDYLFSPRSPVASRLDINQVVIAGHSDGAETALAAGTTSAPPGEPSYRAIVLFGAQPVPGAGGHNPPILVGQGDQDSINPPSNGYSTFDQAASPKYLLVMRGGGHLPPLEAGSEWLPGIEAETEAFLAAYVTREGPVAAMKALAARDPYLSLESG